MARKLRITVDPNVCVGNAMCEHFASNTFALNDDRQSMVANPEGDPEEKTSGSRLAEEMNQRNRSSNGSPRRMWKWVES